MGAVSLEPGEAEVDEVVEAEVRALVHLLDEFGAAGFADWQRYKRGAYKLILAGRAHILADHLLWSFLDLRDMSRSDMRVIVAARRAPNGELVEVYDRRRAEAARRYAAESRERAKERKQAEAGPAPAPAGPHRVPRGPHIEQFVAARAKKSKDGCLVWPYRIDDGFPSGFVHGRRRNLIVALLEAAGHRLDEDDVLVRTCGLDRCCNYDHIQIVKRVCLVDGVTEQDVPGLVDTEPVNLDTSDGSSVDVDALNKAVAL